MKIFTEPFDYAVFDPPEELFEYAKSIYPDPPALSPGIRTNIDLHDQSISSYIDSVVDEAYEAFLPRLQAEYPKMDFDSLETRRRYLWSHNTRSSQQSVVRGLHLDNGTKILVGLWYFKDPADDAGGHLFLMNPLTHKTTIFPYQTNKLVIFPNTMVSWHAVTVRQPSSMHRRFINIVMESDTFLHSYNKTGIDEPREKVVNNWK